jgi:type I restriction enzyme S subunit
VLFTTQASIDQLKQTILQLAVMGKLVKQDPNDEPASKLLERIATEKQQLIKDGKIKKQKPLPPISDGEKPFALPTGWEWVILQEITSKITDGDHQTPPRITSGFKLLSAKNVRDGYVDMDICDFIAEEHFIKSRERCLPEEGDLMIVSVGGTIGRSSVVPKDSAFALVRSVALIKLLKISPFYFKYAMDSQLLQESIHARKRGGAQPCLYLSEIGKFPFSLPPLTEQHRIVAKVDELIALCDSLKINLNQAQTTQLQLTDAIVEQAL